MQKYEPYFCEKSLMNNYHVCISGDNEILFRSEEDYIRAFNTLAIAVAETGSYLNADSIMSTHMHICVRTDNILSLIRRFWKSYTRYFNSRYGRKGPLGSRPYIVEIAGFNHWLTAICYVLRNAVHHGVAPTPFAYRHSSANAIFRKETGKSDVTGNLPLKSYYKYLPKGTTCPSGYIMDSSGLIKRESVLDLADIEHMFGTPRSFLFYMNRLSGEEWRREQEKDNNSSAPVSLDMIERNASFQNLSEMLNHESGRSNYKVLTDIELCSLVDKEILPLRGKRSIYELSVHEKLELLKQICTKTHIPESRVCRCLAM